jgi:hypothetical protein
MELVKGEFFEVSGINCSIEIPSLVTAVISAAQFRFSRPWVEPTEALFWRPLDVLSFRRARKYFFHNFFDSLGY